MTYVIALYQPGLNCLIVDCRVSWEGKNGEWFGSNTSLKSGLFFPRCMFARVGSMFASRMFIKEFKESILGSKATIGQVWSHLEEFTSEYPYDEDSHFKLILSSRHSGSPQFYELDSKEGLSAFDCDANSAVTFGSGKRVLDQYVFSDLKSRMAAFIDFAAADEVATEYLKPALIVPYLMSLWLCELSLTHGSFALERNKVGGVFHFNVQSETAESGQSPALYIFSSATKSGDSEYTFHSWSFRVAHVAGCLYLQKHVPEGQAGPESKAYTETHIVADTASRLDTSHAESKNLIREIREKAGQLPYYEFAGIGAVDPALTGRFRARLANSSTRDEVWDENGIFTPQFREMIFSLFAEAGYFGA